MINTYDINISTHDLILPYMRHIVVNNKALRHIWKNVDVNKTIIIIKNFEQENFIYHKFVNSYIIYIVTCDCVSIINDNYSFQRSFNLVIVNVY